MIEVQDLTKRYGAFTAVDGISFEVRPGVVTGFLGPNGAGKSTTMRVVLGLDRPTSGSTSVNGRSYRDAPAPLAELGALLDAKAVDKGRSARNHLLALGATIGIGPKRVDEVLQVVGLTEVAHQKAGQFSLGMSQRLGIASALLADPATVMLDEPVNGLDPDGILWIRNLLKELAREGRTVFVSSHLMSEMELTAEHILIIGRGRILTDQPMADFIGHSSQGFVRVVSPDAARLRERLLLWPGASVTTGADGELEVRGVESGVVGELAAAEGAVLHQLADIAPSLEEAFMELTRESVSYRGTSDGETRRPAPHHEKEQVAA